MERRLAAVDCRNDFVVDINVDDFVAHIGETRGDCRADVAAADNTDIHNGFTVSALDVVSHNLVHHDVSRQNYSDCWVLTR